MFKHIVALLLEDARRLNEIEPNTQTKSRVAIAEEALEQESKNSDPSAYWDNYYREISLELRRQWAREGLISFCDTSQELKESAHEPA